MRKITIATWKKNFRPYWSPNLPHSGVETVAASNCRRSDPTIWAPPAPRSPTIVRRVETIVWSRRGEQHPEHQCPDDHENRQMGQVWQCLAGAHVSGGAVGRGPGDVELVTLTSSSFLQMSGLPRSVGR